jgi:hypothetical protein
LIFTTVVFVIYEFEVTSLKEFLLITHNLGKYLWLVRLLLAALLFNAYTDYLSLFAIRSLLIRSGTKAVMGLSLGTLSAATIIFVANVLRGLVLFLNSIDLPGVWRYPTLLWGTLSTQLFSMDTFSIWHTGALFIWPAVAVFAWLPLLALGILTIRALTPLSWIVAKAQWALREGDQHPLRAIGCVAAVAVFSIAVGLRATITT